MAFRAFRIRGDIQDFRPAQVHGAIELNSTQAPCTDNARQIQGPSGDQAGVNSNLIATLFKRDGARSQLLAFGAYRDGSLDRAGRRDAEVDRKLLSGEPDGRQAHRLQAQTRLRPAFEWHGIDGDPK